MWLSVSQALPMFDKPVCSYCPARGLNKDLFCCSTAVQGKSVEDWRCEAHKTKKGRGLYIIQMNTRGEFYTTLMNKIIAADSLEKEKKASTREISRKSSSEEEEERPPSPERRITKKAVTRKTETLQKKTRGRPKKLVQTELGPTIHIDADSVMYKYVREKRTRWVYPLEFIKILKYTSEHWCAYSPFKGSNKGLICGNPAYKPEEQEWGPDFWNDRCSKCWSKRGVAQGLMLAAAMSILRPKSIADLPRENQEEDIPDLIDTRLVPLLKKGKEFVQNKSLSSLLPEGDWYIMLGERNYLLNFNKYGGMVYGYLTLDNPKEDNITMEYIKYLKEVDSNDETLFSEHAILVSHPIILHH